MLTIRLSRGGAKKRPFYTIVATDSRKPRDGGRNIKRLGYFNPVATGGEIRLHIETDRVKHLISLGAKPSERVSHLLKEYEKSNQQ